MLCLLTGQHYCDNWNMCPIWNLPIFSGILIYFQMFLVLYQCVWVLDMCGGIVHFKGSKFYHIFFFLKLNFIIYCCILNLTYFLCYSVSNTTQHIIVYICCHIIHIVCVVFYILLFPRCIVMWWCIIHVNINHFTFEFFDKLCIQFFFLSLWLYPSKLNNLLNK